MVMANPTQASVRSRAGSVVRAAQQVRLVADWLQRCDWPIPLDDVQRAIETLDDAAWACALDDGDGREHAAQSSWLTQLQQKVPRRPNLLRELAVFAVFSTTFAPNIRAGEADAVNLRRLGLLAARVLTAAAEDYKALERHQEHGRRR